MEAHARVRRLARGELFLRPGDHAIDCGTILSGLIREYFLLADGRGVTRGFAGPGENVGSLSDLLLGAPARSSVVAEAEARVVMIPWRRFRAIADQRPAWDQVIAGITERLYLAKAAREYELLALDRRHRRPGDGHLERLLRDAADPREQDHRGQASERRERQDDGAISMGRPLPQASRRVTERA